MWVIRTVKNINTRKIESVKVIDETNKSFMEFSASDVKKLIKSVPGFISNLELDNYSNLKISTMTNHRNSKAYKATIRGDYTIEHYCIVTGYFDGYLNWIADDSNLNGGNNRVLWGEAHTVNQIADSLGVKLPELKFFNAYIDKVKDQDYIFLYAGNNKFKQLGAIAEKTEANTKFGNGWVSDYENTVNGIYVHYLEHKQGLLDATLPNSIYHIEKFGGGVNTLILPDSLHSLGEECCIEADDLYKLKFGKGLLEIPYRCFAETNLEEIKFSGAEKIIGECSFADCYKLSCNIVTAAELIGDNAFDMCPIQGVILSKAKAIGKEAFNDTKVKQVLLNNGLRLIGTSAFRNCIKLESIEIPSSVERIGSYAFDGCKKLKTVYMSKKTTVGKNAFPKNTKVILR